MNRLFGYAAFSTNINLFSKKVKFETPLWKPDHIGHFSDESIFLSSMQRFITPQCHQALMPIHHHESGYILIADAYLTQRQFLCNQLNADIELADANLILLAYLKWGHEVCQHLSGEFCFALWNPSNRSLFVATDHFNRRPLLYAYKEGHSFIFSNEISPFRAVCPTLTINENMFAHFALDSLPGAETCYKEVFKLLPGHQLYVTPRGIKKTCYWRLQNQRKKLPYRTRDTYYEAFREIFQAAVQDALRTSYPIISHISGGLDSTSVAAQAAALLTKQQRPLFGFTAIPNGLEGPSDRNGWVYHEMPIVQTLLDRYPIIKHHAYYASPKTDIFRLLQDYYPFIDQPFRNVSNMEWILGCYAEAHKQNSRVILIGAKGNSTISWAAFSSKRWLRHWMQWVSAFIKPHTVYHNFFEYCQPDFLNSQNAKNILRNKNMPLFPHLFLLLSTRATLSRTAQYGLALYNGVVSLDPTHDLNVIEFCYNVPDWVHRSGDGALANRLLVRRGLSHLLPDSITSNVARGEQASDWFLHYNEHATSWKTKLHSVNTQTKHLLNCYYDPEKFENYYNQYPPPITNTNAKIRRILDTSLMRYMSAAFFLDYLNDPNNNGMDPPLF